MKTKYPRIEQFGLTINRNTDKGISGVYEQEIKIKLDGKQYAYVMDAMRGQTYGENGFYVYDLEAILERMESGKLTGTQLFWD